MGTRNRLRLIVPNPDDGPPALAFRICRSPTGNSRRVQGRSFYRRGGRRGARRYRADRCSRFTRGPIVAEATMQWMKHFQNGNGLSVPDDPRFRDRIDAIVRSSRRQSRIERKSGAMRRPTQIRWRTIVSRIAALRPDHSLDRLVTGTTL
jgi:hypothetical protein